jgi:hypothetical protein
MVLSNFLSTTTPRMGTISKADLAKPIHDICCTSGDWKINNVRGKRFVIALQGGWSERWYREHDKQAQIPIPNFVDLYHIREVCRSNVFAD